MYQLCSTFPVYDLQQFHIRIERNINHSHFHLEMLRIIATCLHYTGNKIEMGDVFKKPGAVLLNTQNCTVKTENILFFAISAPSARSDTADFMAIKK